MGKGNDKIPQKRFKGKHRELDVIKDIMMKLVTMQAGKILTSDIVNKGNQVLSELRGKNFRKMQKIKLDRTKRLNYDLQMRLQDKVSQKSQ